MTDAPEPQIHALPEGNFPAPSGRYFLKITEVTSYLLVTFRKARTLTGTPEEIEAFYRRVRAHNLAFGWWGFPVGLIWTPMVLSRNQRAFEKFRGLVSSGAVAPSWQPDPTGRHGARYWDGNAWTDRVRDVATDPVPHST